MELDSEDEMQPRSSTSPSFALAGGTGAAAVPPPAIEIYPPLPPMTQPKGGAGPRLPERAAVEPKGAAVPPLPKRAAVEPKGAAVPPLPKRAAVEPKGTSAPPLSERAAVKPKGAVVPPLPKTAAVEPKGTSAPPLPERAAVKPNGAAAPLLPKNATVEPKGMTTPPLPERAAVEPNAHVKATRARSESDVGRDNALQPCPSARSSPEGLPLLPDSEGPDIQVDLVASFYTRLEACGQSVLAAMRSGGLAATNSATRAPASWTPRPRGAVDPDWPLCPFELRGTCEDSACRFQMRVDLQNAREGKEDPARAKAARHTAMETEIPRYAALSADGRRRLWRNPTFRSGLLSSVLQVSPPCFWRFVPGSAVSVQAGAAPADVPEAPEGSARHARQQGRYFSVPESNAVSAAQKQPASADSKAQPTAEPSVPSAGAPADQPVKAWVEQALAGTAARWPKPPASVLESLPWLRFCIEKANKCSPNSKGSAPKGASWFCVAAWQALGCPFVPKDSAPSSFLPQEPDLPLAAAILAMGVARFPEAEDLWTQFLRVVPGLCTLQGPRPRCLGNGQLPALLGKLPKSAAPYLELSQRMVDGRDALGVLRGGVHVLLTAFHQAPKKQGHRPLHEATRLALRMCVVLDALQTVTDGEFNHNLWLPNELAGGRWQMGQQPSILPRTANPMQQLLPLLWREGDGILGPWCLTLATMTTGLRLPEVRVEWLPGGCWEVLARSQSLDDSGKAG